MNDVLRAMLLNMLQSYVQTSMYATQKLLLSQRRPNQWQIDNAFAAMFQNVPQYAAQCQQPMMEQNKPAIDPAKVQAMITQLSNTAPQQAPHTGRAVGAQATWDGTQWVANP
jgi:hypothetical protein